MRQAAVLSGGAHAPFWPYSPTSFWRRDNTLSPRDPDQTLAGLAINQLFYNDPTHTFTYPGMGYIGAFAEGFASSLFEFQVSTGLFIVTAADPTQRVALVKQPPEGTEEEERPPGAKDGLQALLTAIRIANPAFTILGLTSAGTDHNWCAYEPNTGRLVEFWRFAERATGEWRSPSPGIVNNAATWNGNWYGSGGHESKWGASASGLSLTAGLITWKDIEEVLRGQKTSYGHALKLILPVTAPSHRLPARYNDSNSHTPELGPLGEPNPAAGFVDAVPEGAHLILPKDLHPEDIGISRQREPLTYAAHETLRLNGTIVIDGGGNSGWRIEWPGILGSRYCSCQTNPLAGYEGVGQKAVIEAYTSLINPAYTDKTLRRITESFNGAHGIGQKLRPALTHLELLAEYAE